MLADKFIIYFTDTEVANCGPTQFMCGNHQECIDRKYRCDVNVDCKDGTDEDKCSTFQH